MQENGNPVPHSELTTQNPRRLHKPNYNRREKRVQWRSRVKLWQGMHGSGILLGSWKTSKRQDHMQLSATDADNLKVKTVTILKDMRLQSLATKKTMDWTALSEWVSGGLTLCRQHTLNLTPVVTVLRASVSLVFWRKVCLWHNICLWHNVCLWHNIICACRVFCYRYFWQGCARFSGKGKAICTDKSTHGWGVLGSPQPGHQQSTQQQMGVANQSYTSSR